MAEYDCRNCKMWKGCPGKEWYHFGEIRWCPQQMLWILSYKEVFKAGDWVAKHEESGESRHFNSEAYFVKAGIVIGEVEVRLGRTPNRGKSLITEVEDGKSLEDLSDGAYEILMYVKGKDRKAMDFYAWRRERRYNQRKNIKKPSPFH